MKRNLFIFICLSFVTFSLVSVVVCEENFPVKITDLDVYVKSSSINYVNFPSISDDGSKVAFIAHLEYASENDEIVFLDYNSAEIFAVNSDGSDLKQVTNKMR